MKVDVELAPVAMYKIMLVVFMLVCLPLENLIEMTEEVYFVHFDEKS